MEKLELVYIDGVISKINTFSDGKEYIIETPLGYETLRIRSYSGISVFLVNELGVNDNSQLGKEIILIKDKNRLLALKSNYNIIFIRDIVKPKCISAYYNENTKYIKETYNITEEDLIKIIKEETRTKIKK